MVEYQRRVIHGTYQRYNSSGLSGDYPPIQVCASGEVVICSGLHVVADVEIIASSGLFVQISGQHVFVESGVHIIGTFLASGQPVTISGDHVFVESGVFVQISGQHVVTGGTTDVSGEMIHIGCADTIRTADLVGIIGGSSGFIGGSGGQSICVSGYWCSGLVHTVTVKNMDGNEDMFIGGSGCKPFSGHGYVLGGNETHTFDVCTPCVIYAVSVLSGEFLTWIGTDY